MSFGSVDPSYSTQSYSYGDSYNYRENRYLSGAQFNNSGKINGGVYYNKTDFSYSELATEFKNNYMSDEENYLKSLSEQSILMYNALSTRLGNKTNLQFDEKYFYVNQQFKEYGTTVRKYMFDMGINTKAKMLGIRENLELDERYYFLNPMVFAGLAKNNKTTNFEDKNIAIFDYYSKEKLISTVVINKDSLEPEIKNQINLTAEENQKLQAGREEYKKTMEYLEKDGENGYDITPQDTEPGNLVAGKLKQSKKDGWISYMNVSRVGAGLHKLVWDTKPESLAQHKAVLTSYNKKKLGLQISHVPSRPDGITDAFWQAASGRNSQNVIVESYGENIGWASGFKNVNYAITGHTDNWIDDTNNAMGLNMGHRNAILNPYAYSVAGGLTDTVATLEFWNTKSSNVTASAWPAEGITFMETLRNKVFYWNIKFYDKYYVTNNTEVKVTNLSTGKQWSFIPNQDVSGQTYRISVNENFGSSIGNQVIWGANDLKLEEGDTYQVEVSKLKDATNGTTNNKYTYRSTIKYADTSTYEKYATTKSIKIVAQADAKKDKNNNIIVPEKSTVKLSAQIDENTKDCYIKWSSSNPNIISVTQNGKLEVKKLSTEPVTITAYSSKDNSIKQTVKVIGQESIKLLKGDVNKDGKIKLYDAIQILRQSILNNKIDEETKWIMDWNDDGQVKLYDALQVLRKAILG